MWRRPTVLLLMIALPTMLCLRTIDDVLAAKNKRPPEHDNQALSVKLGMYLESLGNFRSTEMSFDVDLYIYLSWRDSRLVHNMSDHVLVNDDAIRKKMWLPDLYFANARQAHFHQVTVPNFNLFIAQDGTVAYSCRSTLSVACNLNLKAYPMDDQECGIRVLSYAYVANQVNVTWFLENPIRYNPEINLPEFRITTMQSDYCNGSYRYAMTANSHKIGEFSCLTGNIHLSRSIGYNLVQSYIPTGLIVMISWVSFWIDRRAVPARVTLSFTTLVSLTTLGNGLRFGLPQVSYAKAIDLWYGACMLFVFCALLEFAIINSYMRKAEKYDSMAKKHAILSQRERTALRNGIPTIKGDCGSGFVYPSEFGEMKMMHRNGGTRHIRPPRLSQMFSGRNDVKCSVKIEPDYHMVSTKTNGKEDTESEFSNQSIYDNLSPLQKRLFGSEDMENSEDDSWSNETEKKIPNGGLAGMVDHDNPIYYQVLSRGFSRQALKIDKVCRYLFPLVFMGWNAVYWWYYLVYQKGLPNNTNAHE